SAAATIPEVAIFFRRRLGSGNFLFAMAAVKKGVAAAAKKTGLHCTTLRFLLVRVRLNSELSSVLFYASLTNPSIYYANPSNIFLKT
ncbi:Unknown protein, partial [Striga hermonthica]